MKNVLNYTLLLLVSLPFAQFIHAQSVLVNSGWDGRITDYYPYDDSPDGSIFDVSTVAFLVGVQTNDAYSKGDIKFDTINCEALDELDFGCAEITFYLRLQRNSGDTSLLQNARVIVYTSDIQTNISRFDWSPSYSTYTTDIAVFDNVLTATSSSGYYTLSGPTLDAAIASVFADITSTKQLGIRIEFTEAPVSNDANNHYYSIASFENTDPDLRPKVTFKAAEVVTTGWDGRLRDSAPLDGVPDGGIYDRTTNAFLAGVQTSGTYSVGDIKFDTINHAGLDALDFDYAEIGFYLNTRNNSGDTSLLQNARVVVYTSTVTTDVSMSDWSEDYNGSVTDIAVLDDVLTAATPTGYIVLTDPKLDAALAAVSSQIATIRQLGIRFEFPEPPGTNDGYNHYYSIASFDNPIADRRPTLTFTTAEWLPIDMSDLIVQSGTALDFSGLHGQTTVGQYGFASINVHGELVFTNNPGSPLRLFCAPLPLTDFPYQTQTEITALAHQIAMAGYNAVRLHWLDLYLMYGAAQDLQFNPTRLDTFFRLMAALRQEGVYVILDATSSSTMYHAITTTWGSELDMQMKTDIYHDTAARTHWQQGVSLLLSTVNPYTGLALKNDPQLVLVGARNEPNIGFCVREQSSNRDAVIADLLPEFQEWLEQKYTSVAALAQAWGPELPAEYGFAEVEWPTESSETAYADLLNFFTDTEQETYEWESNYLHNSVGLTVPVTDYNVGGSLQTLTTMNALSVIDTHAYHDHPSDYGVGATINATSMTSYTASIIRTLSGRRFLEKPFAVTEWGSPFFNPWRHESGMIVGSYASFQGWQLLAQHAYPVGLSMDEPIRFFRVYRDPSLRAAERMAALLYARGDVAEASTVIGIGLGTEEELRESPLLAQALPSELTRLGLVGKIGVIVDEPSRAYIGTPAPSAIVTPTHGATVTTTVGSEDTMDIPDDQVTEAVIDGLKTMGAIPMSNLSDPAAGVYDSETGELLLDSSQGFFSVDTSRSQGASLHHRGTAVELNDTVLENRGCPVALLASSVDANPLSTSGRILIIAATDARNSGMQFEKIGVNMGAVLEVLNMGDLPVLIRPAHFKITFPDKDPALYEAWSLRQNGTRADALTLTPEVDGFSLEIAANKLPSGPTNYFELVLKDD